MPSILSDDDKQTVKRNVPKANNKIHAVAVAKLYISHPQSQRWTYTGLQGAAVLANDLVGNTYWIKLVDVSSSSRGVIWDQEIYDTFQYHQDRTFFHSFELEDCMAGLSFADEKEAKQFKKKMDERESNAHKNTKGKPFANGLSSSAQVAQPQQAASGKSRFGLSKLLGGHRNSTASLTTPTQSIIPPRSIEVHSPAAAATPSSAVDGIDLSDPDVQAVLRDLKGMGITEDQIEEHAAFIKTYLAQHKASAAVEAEKADRAARAPPPPPPTNIADISPQHTGSSSGTPRRGPPPVAPPSRRSNAPQRPPSPPASPQRAPSPPRHRFRAPPALADAGKFAHEERAAPALPTRDANTGPAPPPRPPKEPLEDQESTKTGHAVPPPFTGTRLPSNASAPPLPPTRNSGPPAPPPRDTPSSVHVPPPPPREVPSANAPPPPPRESPSNYVPPPPPKIPGLDSGPPPPPPLPPSSARPVPVAPTSAVPPPPPPLPPSSAGNGPPPPPPMPPRAGAETGVGADTAAGVPKVAAPGRDGLLADIRGGARLRKVADSDKKDRSGAMVPGSESTGAAASSTTAASGATGAGDAQGGLAGALASALAARKSKVSHSDDEDDNDDW